MVHQLLRTAVEVYKRRGLGGCWNSFLGLVTLKVLPDKVFYHPVDIQIEPTSRCNSSCIMCGRTYLDRKNGDMSFKHFKDIVNQFPYLRLLTLQGLGEPLLNPDIFRMIEYAKSKDITVRFSNNATRLTPRNCEKLVSSELDHIFISLDGATSKSYEKIRVGANFKEVIRNIDRLVKTKKKLNKNFPEITLDTIGMKTNLEEIPKIVELAHSLDIHNINIRHLNYDFTYRNGSNPDKSKMISVANSLKNESLFTEDPSKVKDIFNETLEISKKLGIALHLPGIEPSQIKGLRCVWPWYHTYIDFEGYMTPCCVCPDKDEICFGNILEQPFDKIWNNKQYRDFRSKLSSGIFPNVCNGCMRSINVQSSYIN